ncbi:putative pectate lyase 16 [Apostasia shenzhenica]|uniref:Pectate lyase n=1 Tax=Apostasia shenzhenica TaxID=1088818 RepID=A0A2I0B8G6_9ASPA|nr:putative pectate lyase 16 [Apostasia shenzhenica]
MENMATNTPPILILTLFVLLCTTSFSVSLAAAGMLQRQGSSMNSIDRCWRRDTRWAANRQQLASCSVGFAGKMINNGGRGLRWYVVTDAGDSPASPQPGTLRYGATMIAGKVWITFARDMQIKLERPLLVSSFTTIDGRGAVVQIAGGCGFVLDKVHDVIIHGLHFHHNRATPAAVGPVAAPGGKTKDLWGADGDAIRLISSSKIWIDHNTLFTGEDGLIDVTRGSTDITISNNWFRDHDKVMLLGHDDGFSEDRRMRVTVAFNRFGPNCNQRMPRIRHGYAHVANNLYEGWKIYAIGGSMNPKVKSEGNLFIAPPNQNKAVTWREAAGGEQWRWKSVNDVFENGAFFGKTEIKGLNPGYDLWQRFTVGKASSVRLWTKFAGALRCSSRTRC